MKKAFTLIELLIVIAVIGILAGIVVYSVSGAQKKSRDNTRKADIEQIASALEMYKQANGKYPAIDGAFPTAPNSEYGREDYQYIRGINTGLDSTREGTSSNLYKSLVKYLSPIPRDQRDTINVFDWKQKYIYQPSLTWDKYILYVFLENSSSGNSINKKCYYRGTNVDAPLFNGTFSNPDQNCGLNNIPN